MKTINHLKIALFVLLGLSLIIVSCKKTPDVPTPVPQPVTTITAISPATAPVGSTLVITGTNFSTDPASNTVSIGGVTATIVSASPTQLVVVVPAGTTNGTVSVTAGGQTAQSPTSFTVAIPALKPVKEVSGTTFANLNWKKDTIYLLRGMVYIPANFTLTIEPGTVIKGAGPERDPAGTNRPGTLVIERLGKIIAPGTATQPIVFTSSKAVNQRTYGDWGGLVLVGKAPVNQAGTIPNPNGVRGTVETYGEPNDNSGVLQYVRIEYAGASQPTTPASKLGGLTLLGVGYQTVIDHIQVSYSGGDAFSWFGGSANMKNLFAYRAFDDNWSVDWGYVGNVQFGVSLRDPDVADLSGSNGFEVENYTPNTSTDVSTVILINGLPQSAPVFTNISDFAYSSTPIALATPRGTGAYKSAMYLRRNTAINIYNSIFYGYPEGLRVESAGGTALTGGTIDLKGVVLANMSTPIVGAGVLTTAQVTTFFSDPTRSNQIIATSDVATLLLNTANFSLTAPNFLPQNLSPLLGGAATGGKLANTFFTSVAYRGAFGTQNWLSGWTNVSPQTTDYDR